MESKGRRTPRAAGPSVKPVEAAPSAETRRWLQNPLERSANEPISATPQAKIVPPEAVSILPRDPGSAGPPADIVAPEAISVLPTDPGSVEPPADIVVPAPIFILPSDQVSAEPPAEGAMPTATSMAAPSVEALAETVKSASPKDLAGIGSEAFAALVQSQTAVARGLEALSAELTGLALSTIDTATRTATDLLAVRTLSDAIEVNAGFGRNSFVALVGGSAKLSELGAKLAAEASQPILKQLGEGWIRAARFAF